MNEKFLRKSTADLLVGVMRPLVNAGVMQPNEYEAVASGLRSIVNGANSKTVKTQFVDGPTTASMLSLSYSSFRQMQSAGELPSIPPHRIGSKSIRFLLSDIVEYMESLSLVG